MSNDAYWDEDPGIAPNTDLRSPQNGNNGTFRSDSDYWRGNDASGVSRPSHSASQGDCDWDESVEPQSQPDSFRDSASYGWGEDAIRNGSSRGWGHRRGRGGRFRGRGDGFRDSRGDARGGRRPEPHGEPFAGTISSRDRGRLIGERGANVRAIQSDSGACVVVGEGFGQATEIKVYGSDLQKDQARALIERQLGYSLAMDKAEEPTSRNQDEQIDWGAFAVDHERRQKEKWAKCPPIVKDFYEEHPDVLAMSDDKVTTFRRDNNNISVSGFRGEDDVEQAAEASLLLKPCPLFQHSFWRFPAILETIRRQNFERPSPIQAQAWPYLLKGKDLIGIAQTGTGKTLAFLLPAFIHIDGQPTPRAQRRGPSVLVLSPTRELALQIADEVKKYEYKGIKSVCVYGGGDRRDQMKTVTKGVEIVIATPGRLNDLVEAGVIAVESVTYLVLDEADRMLDLGFEPQIRKVLLDIRPERQTVMTSATWPPGVRRLASQYMTDPVTVCIGTLDLAAVHSVTQEIVLVDDDADKMKRLLEFLDAMDSEDKAIVFVGKKARADNISSDLILKGYVVQSIHGDRVQSDRERALADLKSGEVRILIATDVASRGIDIQDVTFVFNYDFPRNIEEYVHRVGRTGRAGKTGVAVTLVERRGADWKSAQELIAILAEAGQEVPSELADMAARFARAQERNLQARPTGGDGCFNCGQSGHFSRECPNGGRGQARGQARGPRGGGGGRGQGACCFKCGQSGHVARACPEAQLWA